MAASGTAEEIKDGHKQSEGSRRLTEPGLAPGSGPHYTHTLLITN